MKLNYLLYLSILSLPLVGCSEEYPLYSGANMIQFYSTTNQDFSFVYEEESKNSVDLIVDIATVGDVVNYDRTIRFEQITKEWNYTYDEVDKTKKIDSSYVDMKFPAVLGIHYQLESQNNELVMPAGKNILKQKITLLRHESLLKNNYTLKFRLIDSDDFAVGEPAKLNKTIVISNNLLRPTFWKDTAYDIKTTVGNWSEVKHRFMIKVTGERWDDAFLRKMVNDYDNAALFAHYLKIMKEELAAYNADPANTPPMVDENNNVVVFP